VVKNSTSSGARLPESDQAEMDVFMQKVLQLLPILGIDLFRVIGNQNSDAEELLYCKIKGLEARGKRTANGFVVFKGSQAVKEHRASTKRWAAKREMYLADGLLSQENDNLIFTKDFEFTSPSTAAAVICGGATNGLKQWRSRAGVQLKDLD
jgi:hypothetical protein